MTRRISLRLFGAFAAIALLATTACSQDPNAPATKNELNLSNDAAVSETTEGFVIPPSQLADGMLAVEQAGLATIFELFGAGGGYDESFMACSGKSSTNPVIVTNTNDVDQTFSVTINEELSGQATWITGQELVNGYNAGENLADGGYCGAKTAGTTIDVTVPANTTVLAGALAAGGGTYGTNNETSDNNVAIGAGGDQWYDYWLHVDSATFAFESLELNYGATGGINPSLNTQTGLFNGLECYTSDTGEVTFGSPLQLTTPYSDRNANAWKYEKYQPICFGFLTPDTEIGPDSTQNFNAN